MISETPGHGNWLEPPGQPEHLVKTRDAPLSALLRETLLQEGDYPGAALNRGILEVSLVRYLYSIPIVELELTQDEWDERQQVLREIGEGNETR